MLKLELKSAPAPRKYFSGAPEGSVLRPSILFTGKEVVEELTGE